MASVAETIRRLTLRFTTEGADQAIDKLKQFGKAQQDVAATSEQSTRAQQSAERSLNSISRQYDQAYRAQQSLAKVERDLATARAQGLVSQQRAGELMQLAIRYHNQAGVAAKAHATALEEVSSHANIMAANLGSAGRVLASLGAPGLAAAAAIGALAVGFHVAAGAALEFADKAGKLRDTAETVGFTTDQLQALNIIAADVSVNSEQLTTGIERFSVSFNELKDRTGAAYLALVQINPAIAREVSNAKNLAEAWDLVFKAMQQADSEQRNALARQLFGRGGVGLTRVGGETSNQGGLDNAVKSLNQLDLITQQQINHVDDLGDAIKRNFTLAQQNIVSAFAEPTLERIKGFSDALLEFSRNVKSFDWENSWLPKFASWAVYLIPTIGPLKALFDAISGAMRGGESAPAQVTTGGSAGIIGPVLPPDEAARLKDAASAADVYRQRAIQAANDSKRFMQALGETATPAERLKDQIIQLNATIAREPDVAEGARTAISRLKAEYEVSQLRNNVNALGDAATSTEKYKLKVAELRQELDQGKISQETFTRAVAAADPIMSKIRDTAEQLGSSLASAFINGSSAAQAFNSSLKAVASTAASAAINNLIKGDWIGAAISGVVAVGAGLSSLLFGGDDTQSKQQAQQAQQAQLALTRQIQQINAQTQLAGINTQTRSGALQAFDIQAQAERDAQFNQLADQFHQGLITLAQGMAALDALDRQHAAERLAIEQQFNDQEKQQQEQANADALRVEQERIAAEQEAQKAAAEAAERAAEALRQRLAALDDRLLAAVTDTNTLEGALTIFDRETQRQREQELAAGGGALVKLEEVRMAERLKLIQDFQDKAVEAEKQAAQERLNAINSAAKSIVDYLNGLMTGPQSALSPSGRLQAAQSAFNAQLALAQSGNVSAQSGITKFAEDLRVAAQAFYGSSSGYQSVLTQIQSGLGGLPAVAQTNDPVTIALREAILPAIQGTTAAVEDTTTSVDEAKVQANIDATIQKGVLDIIDASTQATTAQVTSANALQVTANSLINSSNAFLNSMNTLLDAISINTAVLISSENHLDHIESNTSSIVARTSEISSHTSHMYAPGGSLLFGLARGGVVPDSAMSRMFYRAYGGAIGTDTVPAMLTPGEFVVRAPVARANAAALDEFNSSGQWPANDNLMSRIADLLEQIAGNTGATASGTINLAREQRFSARKGAA